MADFVVTYFIISNVMVKLNWYSTCKTYKEVRDPNSENQAGAFEGSNELLLKSLETVSCQFNFQFD